MTKGFIKLLKRYKEGTLPDHVKEAMDIWYHSVHKDPVEKNEKGEIRERIWTAIEQEKDRAGEADPGFMDFRRRRWRGMWKVAAVVLAVSGAAVYFSGLPEQGQALVPAGNSVPGLDDSWVEVVNGGNRVRPVVLSDGSKVTLEPGSRLRHPGAFGAGNRIVYLEGSGFFDVTRDAERPFLVYSGTVLTRVLGTSFTIKSIARTGGTEVAVVTGKVVVEKARYGDQEAGPAESESRIVLTPNKKVTFFKDSDHYVTGLVENPVLVSDQEMFVGPGAFHFDETPLSEVLDKLESAYGVEITISDDAMLECPVTADVSSESLYGKMEIIGAVLNAKYEITGSSILLSGGGCAR